MTSSAMQGLPENQIDDLKAQLKELRLQLEEDNATLEELASQTTKNVGKMGGSNAHVFFVRLSVATSTAA